MLLEILITAVIVAPLFFVLGSSMKEAAINNDRIEAAIEQLERLDDYERQRQIAQLESWM